jgi:3'(2'), 5'-bisphosphate nucleotidase
VTVASGASDLRALVPGVLALARRAAAAILGVYAAAAGPGVVARKADHSPLTEADLAAHRILVAGLEALLPGVPVLSEEAADIPWEQRAGWRRHWLVDPLDGTKEFLSRNGEFTVNVALVEDHRPVLGVVQVPVTGVEYWGLPGFGSWRAGAGGAAPAPILVSARPAPVVRVVGSRSHRGASLDGFLARVGAHELVSMGSSLKFCLLAEGRADVYPRLGPTSEWDTAAAQAVVEGAGGRVLRLDGQPLDYNAKPALLNPDFVAFGPAATDWLALLRAAE